MSRDYRTAFLVDFYYGGGTSFHEQGSWWEVKSDGPYHKHNCIYDSEKRLI